MERCPTQAVLPLVGLAAERIIRDWHISYFPILHAFRGGGAVLMLAQAIHRRISKRLNSPVAGRRSSCVSRIKVAIRLEISPKNASSSSAAPSHTTCTRPSGRFRTNPVIAKCWAIRLAL
ncbi:MAG: hypothetical protein R6U98_30315 [Pirellulaceae bacterium]